MSYLDKRKPLSKAKLGELTFQFNPETITYTCGAEFSQARGVGMHEPLYSYTGGKSTSISFEIYLNDMGRRGNVDTNTFCSTLIKYSKYGKETPTPNGEYSTLKFVFGSSVFNCIISDLSIQYLAFDRNLKPIEAKIQITLTLV